jgi:hypothetical protein
LSWFSLIKFEHIHSRMSERQDVSFIDISLKLSRWLYYDVNLSIIGIAMVVHIMAFTNVTNWFRKYAVESRSEH